MTTYAQSRARAARLPQSLTAQRVDTLMAGPGAVTERTAALATALAAYRNAATGGDPVSVASTGVIGAQIADLAGQVLADLARVRRAEHIAHDTAIRVAHERQHAEAALAAADAHIARLLALCVGDEDAVRDQEPIIMGAVAHLARPCREEQATRAAAAAWGRANTTVRAA